MQVLSRLGLHYTLVLHVFLFIYLFIYYYYYYYYYYFIFMVIAVLVTLFACGGTHLAFNLQCFLSFEVAVFLLLEKVLILQYFSKESFE